MFIVINSSFKMKEIVLHNNKIIETEITRFIGYCEKNSDFWFNMYSKHAVWSIESFPQSMRAERGASTALKNYKHEKKKRKINK